MTTTLVRRYPSPLRYPGGKQKVANYMKLLWLRNGFDGYEYVEPYAGGSSVALTLLFEGYASRIHINDLNRGVHAFWHAVLHDTDRLVARIRKARLTMPEWRRQQAVQVNPNAEPLDLAYSTFYLNRTNRSGIIDGGPIGGTDQSGDWGIDARFNKPALIERIEKIARHAPLITLTNLDAARYITEVLPNAPLKTFVYLDPPYYVKGQGLYQNAYEDADHRKIAKLVGTIRQRWLVSYDAQPEIERMYRGRRQLAYGLSYSAAEKYEGAEVMIFGPYVKHPEVESPANLRQTLVDRYRKQCVLQRLA